MINHPFDKYLCTPVPRYFDSNQEPIQCEILNGKKSKDEPQKFMTDFEIRHSLFDILRFNKL